MLKYEEIARLINDQARSDLSRLDTIKYASIRSIRSSNKIYLALLDAILERLREECIHM